MTAPTASTIIRTIARSSLSSAIESSLREGCPVVVVSDGVDIDREIIRECKSVRLGKKYGHYGCVAMNVGMALAETEFGILLDDDDELMPGAGDTIRNTLADDRSADIWIQRIRYRTNEEVCHSSLGLRRGNIAAPIYRCSVFADVPMTHGLSHQEPEFTDYNHVVLCVGRGYKLRWIDKATYLVRPGLAGKFGCGER